MPYSRESTARPSSTLAWTEVVGAVAVRPGEQGVGSDDAGAGEQGGGDGRGLDLATVRNLNGVRVADEILRLVPDAAAFHTTLRCVKESTSCSEDSTAPRRRIIRRIDKLLRGFDGAAPSHHPSSSCSQQGAAAAAAAGAGGHLRRGHLDAEDLRAARPTGKERRRGYRPAGSPPGEREREREVRAGR
uniref:Uncharacterized protein n=1 Tax=Oryza rufipogon TaxID=4529 RepID=A0A0E0QC80_ORYRU